MSEFLQIIIAVVNMTINLQTINNDEEKVRLYCYKNPTRPFWMPSKTCSALINEFTQAAFSSQISKDETRRIAANIAKLPELLALSDVRFWV